MIFGDEILSLLRRFYTLLEWADNPAYYDEMTMLESVIDNWFSLSAEQVEIYSDIVRGIFT